MKDKLPAERPSRLIGILKGFVLPLILTWAVLFVLFYLVFGIDIVDGNSMNPTLHDRDLLLYRRIFIDPQPGDIVIITVPERDKRIVKRIVAADGQTVTVDLYGHVLRDGSPLTEDYALFGQTIRDYDVTFPLQVPDEQIFVLGDNRTISLDSRYQELGTVKREHIIGQVLHIFHPFDAHNLQFESTDH